MITQTNQGFTLAAFFTDAGLGATGLTVTVDVYRNGTLVVTAASATEVGGGIYQYALASGSVTAAGNYYSVFKTAGTADQKHIADSWSVGQTWVDRIDATISSRNATAPLDALATRNALGLASANLDTQLGDLPTNAELATALGTADDSVLAAIAALNNLSAAGAQTAAAAALAAYDPPTRAEATADKSEVLVAMPSAAAIAAAVWGAGTRTLTGFGTLVTDVAASVWSAATRTLSAFGFTPTPSNASETTAIKSVTDALAGMIEPAGPEHRYTAAALEQAPAGEGGTGTGATPAEIADAVCDELLAGHTAVGSVGEALNRLLEASPEAPVVVPTPAESLCNVFLHTSDILTDPVSGLVLKFELSGGPTTAGGVVQKGSATLVTDDEGIATGEFLRTDFMTPAGRTYLVTCPTLGFDRTPFSLETDTFNLADLVQA